MMGNWSYTDLEPGERVCLRREPERLGRVSVVEGNRLSVMVQWDDMDPGELDFQWANKVERVEP
jgi:hypothetical protein